MRRTAARGFTLLEVMIGLALLGLGLVVLIQSTTASIRAAKRAQMMGVATDLSRAKMYDIEETLLKEGFTETDQSEEDRTFDDEGWPEIKYSYKVEQVELPSFDQLQALAKEQGSGAGSARKAGSGAGSDGEPSGSFQDSTLGGVIAMIGGGFSSGSMDIDAKQGADFVGSFYPIIQEGLKASIRKVTLTVKFDVLGEEQELKTVVFFTDATGMDKGVLGAVGAAAGAGSGSGSGSGSGTGGSGTGGGGGSPPRTPTPPKSGSGR